MTVAASASYSYTHENGETDLILVELSTDATYSPDIASDLAARAKTTLTQTIAETWPAPVEAT